MGNNCAMPESDEKKGPLNIVSSEVFQRRRSVALNKERVEKKQALRNKLLIADAEYLLKISDSHLADVFRATRLYTDSYGEEIIKTVDAACARGDGLVWVSLKDSSIPPNMHKINVTYARIMQDDFAIWFHIYKSAGSEIDSFTLPTNGELAIIFPAKAT